MAAADNDPNTNTTSAPLSTSFCGHCRQRTSSMQRCGHCRLQLYCGRDCQKKHWRKHKLVCKLMGAVKDADADQAHPNTPAHAHRCPICCPALQVRIRNPFIALQYGTWLHNRPKNDTYQLLLEAYRLRTGDKRNHQSRPTTPICCGAGFARFLQRAATRVPELLPSWWSDDHARACVEQTTRFFAQKASRRVPPTAQMVAAHFADASMPLQLRIFSCAVCG
ncbi:hypothetical protein HDK64DRAFT_219148, partial [Phyllosticta capitalensis]